jgi:hypothetical protein
VEITTALDRHCLADARALNRDDDIADDIKGERS